jgi:hypothetical protein
MRKDNELHRGTAKSVTTDTNEKSAGRLSRAELKLSGKLDPCGADISV